jgi:ABC-type multidrug transport system ATPase subunit
MELDIAPTIWEALDTWSQELSPWQQYIVGTAATQGKLRREQIDEAYHLFLLETALVLPVEGEETPEIPGALGRPKEALKQRLLLNCVDSLVGINALPEGAKLTFGDALTVIYGENGVGKTGFSRLMSNACFSRHKPEILGDIYNPGETPDQSAQFHISIGETAQEPISFPIQEEESPLKRITVFDTAVARHHLTQSSAFAFKPAGFDVFPEIGRVYGILTEMLDTDIRDRTKPNEFASSLAGNGGAVYDALVGLNAATDMNAVRELAVYGEVESKRITQIGTDIATLQNKASKESIDILRQARTDIDILAGNIYRLEQKFEDAALETRRGYIAKAKETATTAATIGSDQFQRPFFSAVGTPEWERFAQTAHALAKREHADYPTMGAHCLLCERELDEASHAHVRTLLAFVEGDARKAASDAQNQVQAEITTLSQLNVDVFSPTSRVRDHVHRLNAELEEEVEVAVAALASAKDMGIADLQNLDAKSPTYTASGVVKKLTDFGVQLATEITRLEGEKSEAAIAGLELEKRVLRHKQVLSQILPRVEEFVNEAKWVAKATTSKGLLSTRPITDKEKALSEQIITDGYRNKLAEECKLLKCELPVELQTTGQRGQTVRTLAMPGGYKPDAILSEGEQKAVALADFLTEVALNPAAAGIILDDPVTSQDYRRKGKIAERLIKEAGVRQVIIFTHDFIFLSQLCNAAKDAEIEMVGNWIQRDADGNPGQVTHNDLPVTSRHYKNSERAQAFLAQARATTGSESEDLIRQGMAALRSTLEETVVNRVFKEVVPRWSDQVRVTALRNINWDNERTEEICVLYEELSGFIEAHSHTDEARVPAVITDLETAIGKVDELVAWAKPNRPT